MEAVNFTNVGYLIDNIDPNVLVEIKQELEKIKSNFSEATTFKENLVGNIKQEYLINDSKSSIEYMMVSFARKHEEKFKYFESKFIPISQRELRMGPAWVNFQKKHEYNPMHKHSGLFSFVLWIEIPYNMEEEFKSSPLGRPEGNKSGIFEFLYNNALGELRGSPVYADKSYEGKMVIFPAQLNHIVYPFCSSDDYRISIAGNLFLR